MSRVRSLSPQQELELWKSRHESVESLAQKYGCTKQTVRNYIDGFKKDPMKKQLEVIDAAEKQVDDRSKALTDEREKKQKEIQERSKRIAQLEKGKEEAESEGDFVDTSRAHEFQVDRRAKAEARIKDIDLRIAEISTRKSQLDSDRARIQLFDPAGELDEIFTGQVIPKLVSYSQKYLDWYAKHQSAYGGNPKTPKQLLNWVVRSYLAEYADLEWIRPEHRLRFAEYLQAWDGAQTRGAQDQAEREIAQDEAAMRPEMVRHGDLSDMRQIEEGE